MLRDAGLNAKVVVVPAINQTRWEDLARALSNLNQFAYHLNTGRLPEDVRPLLQNLLLAIRDLRAELLGKDATDDC